MLYEVITIAVLLTVLIIAFIIIGSMAENSETAPVNVEVESTPTPYGTEYITPFYTPTAVPTVDPATIFTPVPTAAPTPRITSYNVCYTKLLRL